jgi:hypothetical protein
MIRDQLAAAATLDGTTRIAPRYRQSLQTGDGFVRRGQRVRDGKRTGWLDTWEIWVAIPADRAAAEDWLDAHLDDLIAAVWPVLLVTQATPNELVLGPNTVNGLVITGINAV